MIVKAPAEVKCDHCGLPVPRGLVEPQQENQFCCAGCAGAYRLIHEFGLDSFYKVNSNSESTTLRDRITGPAHFADFSSEAFAKKYVALSSTSNAKVKLALEGIHCGACIWLIEKLPKILPGVQQARVNWSRKTVSIHWNPKQVGLTKIARTLYQLGYAPYPILENDKASHYHRENRQHLIRLGIAAALAGNNMIISATLYLGMFSHMSGGMTQLMRLVSCCIGLAALLLPGRVFLQSALAAVRTRIPHMDLPIALALLMGTTVGTINVIRGSGEIYFDSLSVLIFLLLIGRFLQFRQQSRAADAVEMLYRLTPRLARKKVEGEFVETLAELLESGDVVEVKPGETIPVDGTIRSGGTNVDESILTGESVPIEKTTGAAVFAGSLNQSSTVTITASKTGEHTRLSTIAKLVEESGEPRPQIVQWANRLGAHFVAVIIVLAGATFCYWMNSGIESAVDNTIALLIVACPCALALATPLSIAVALGKAAQSKLMIKTGDVLQALQRPGMIWLDKTGTLTEGNLLVEKWYGDRHCLPIVAAIENESDHPIARAIVQFAETNDHNGPTVSIGKSSIKEHIGQGIVGSYEGIEYAVGKLEFLNKQHAYVSGAMLEIAKDIVRYGMSPCYIARNHKVVAIAAIGDAIRPQASAALRQLRKRGWEIGILSGDHEEIVNRVADRLDINMKYALGNCSPEEKLRTVVNSAKHQTTLMVGDGVNDCAALAAATVGIAVKGGAEASLIAAPVYLAKPGLIPILELFEVSDSTTQTMKLNLGISLAYNVCFAALAVAGFVNPFVAAILMPISSLTLVWVSMNAGRIKSLSTIQP